MHNLFPAHIEPRAAAAAAYAGRSLAHGTDASQPFLVGFWQGRLTFGRCWSCICFVFALRNQVVLHRDLQRD